MDFFSSEHLQSTGKYRCPFCEAAFHAGHLVVAHIQSTHPDCPLVLLLHVDPPAGTLAMKGKIIIEIEVQLDEDTAWVEQYVENRGLRKSCTLCDHTRSTQGGINRHVLAAHFRYYPYQCAYCPKVALGVLKIKEHIEKEHQGKPYKVIRRGKLSYEHAQEHRHKNHEMIHMLDPLPEVMKDSHEVPASQDETSATDTMDSQTTNDMSSPKARYNTLTCKYCQLQLTFSMYNMQRHIFTKHLMRHIAKCNLCDFGTNCHPFEERMQKHHEVMHSGCELNWTNHTSEINERIIPVEEIDDGAIIAVTDEHGAVVDIGQCETESKKRPLTSTDSEPAMKKQRCGKSPVRDLRQRGSPALSVDVSVPGIDASKAAVASTCVDKVEERITSNRTLFGCSECYLLFDRKDKVCYHLQLKHDVKPYLCGICSAKFYLNSMAKKHMQQEHPESSVPTTVQEELLAELRSRIITVMQHCLPNTLPIEGGGNLTVRTVQVASPVIRSPKQPCAKKSTAKPHVPKSADKQPATFKKFPYETFMQSKRKTDVMRPLFYGCDTSMLPNAKIEDWPPLTKEGRQYSCNYCTFTVSTKQSMMNHVIRHTTWRRFSCKACEFRSLVLQVMEQHVEKKHEGVAPPTSKDAHSPPEVYYLNKFTLENLNMLAPEKPTKTASPAKSPRRKQPSVPLQTIDPKNIPELKVVKENPTVYRCNFCIFARADYAKVFEHQKRHVTSYNGFKCALCSYQSEKRIEVVKHTRAKHGKNLPPKHQRPLKSDPGSSGNETADKEKSPRKRNQKTKMDHKPTTTSELEKTQKPVTPRKATKPTKSEPDKTPKPGTPRRAASPKGKKQVRTPRGSQSGSETEEQRTSTDTSVAPQIHTKTVSQVPEPVLVNEKPSEYKCNYCSFSRNMLSAVKFHQRTHYTWRPYVCSQCQFQCFKENKILEHQRLAHKNNSPFQKIPEPETYCLNEKTCASLGIVEEEPPPPPEPQDSDPLSYEGDEDPRFCIKNIPPPKKLPNGSYACNFCPNNAIYGQSSNMVSHQLFHVTHRPWSCKVCGKKFLYRSMATEHMAEHPGQEKSMVENKAPGVFYLTYATRKMLGSRVKQFVWKEASEIKCSRCSEKFDTDSKLHEHLAAEHPECVQFKCLYCQCVLFTKEDFDQHHIELHSESLPDYDIQAVPDMEKSSRACDICHKAIPNSFPLNIHMADQHKGEVDIKCSHCKEVFEDTTKLREHHTRSHERKPVKYHVSMKKSRQLDVITQCPLCPQTMVDEKLDSHLVETHPSEVQYLCKYCSRLLTGTDAMKEHFKDKHGHKKLSYSVVRNIFKNTRKDSAKAAAKASTKKVEAPSSQAGSDADDMCSECSSFHGRALRIHIMDAHFGYRPYLCCFCPFRAASVTRVKDHHHQNHPNETLQVKQRILKRTDLKVDEKLLEVKKQLKKKADAAAKTSTPCIDSPSKNSSSDSSSPNKRSYKKLGIDIHILFSPKTKEFQCKLCKLEAPKRLTVYNHIYSKHKDQL